MIDLNPPEYVSPEERMKRAGVVDDDDFPAQKPNGTAGGASASSSTPLSGPLTAAQLAAGDYPPPEYLMQSFLLRNHVNLLYADGGTGKSLLALHIAVAVAGLPQLFGCRVQRGPVLFVSCEDDLGPLRTRLLAICDGLNVTPNTLSDLHLWSLAGQDACLAAIKDDGRVTPLPFSTQFRAALDLIRPALVVLDTVTDIAALDETKRPAVNALCKQVLGSLCVDFATTLLVLAHPSKAAMSDGSGYAGSTAWNNAVRSRLVLERPADDPKAPRRILRVAKSNHGAEAELDLVLNGCVFEPPGGTGSAQRDHMERKAVLDTLADMRRKGIRIVRHHGNGQKPKDVARAIFDQHGLKLSPARVTDILGQLERDGRVCYIESVRGKNGKLATFEIAPEGPK